MLGLLLNDFRIYFYERIVSIRLLVLHVSRMTAKIQDDDAKI